MRILSRLGIQCLFLALPLALVSCGGEVQAPAIQPEVGVMETAAEQVTLFDELSGRVAAVRRAELRPQISGIVQHLLFEQGTEVKKGDALFQINPEPFQAEVDSAAAALRQAEAAHARTLLHARRLAPLMRAEAVSQQTYDDAVSHREQAAAAVAQARAALARRKLDLKFATVDAPISGRIDQALVTEGALVSVGDAAPMARIQQIDQVYVDVRQPAQALTRTRELLSLASERFASGVQADILDSAGLMQGVSGRLLFSGVSVDEGTGDVLLRILVDNPQRRLLPGMYVQARVPRAHYEQALMLPQQAVIRRGERTSVWVIDDENLARLRPIELGEQYQRRYRVVAGLQSGERVVLEGLERLSEGLAVKVRAIPVSPSEPIHSLKQE